MHPYYESKDVLIRQLDMAQQAYDMGLMNYAHSKKSGCLGNIQSLDMKVRALESKQLTLIDSYIPDWYKQHCVQQGRPIGGSPA